MQFITHGPDIPDALLEAHEDGRVVFFCGAGISYPAGLPGFKGLVEQIYQLNGTARSNIEQEAFGRGQFDATLDLLERRLPGGRLAVRSALAKALKPTLRRKGAIDTQVALLRLARDREGALRLVTTNFDRVFHAAAKRTGQKLQTHAAPMLPIPKNSHWNGLVYLHGLLPPTAESTALNRLVVTSGDFGKAYLTERWAARFVSELFRNYVVCFVGYSINDPVFRYMMDALAADRMLGEATQLAWALGDCKPGQEHRKALEWGAKGVTPILYEVPAGSEERREIDIAPRKRHELVRWLTTPQPERRSFFYEDTWHEVCRTRFFHTLLALCDLARDAVWPAGRWREALQAWSQEGIVLRSWRYAAPLVQTMPDTVTQEIAHDVTRWIEAASESIDRHEGILLDLCQRVLALPLEAGIGINGEPIDQPVTRAINHPVGHITQALINLWFKRSPKDNDLLPADVKPFFTELCDVRVDRSRHGRVLLGSQLITFFRVDRPWTEQYLLPLFSWNNPTEAKGVWEGFLWSPRVYPPLLTAFKPQLLESANHYTDLGEHRQQFAAFLTYAALGPTDGYTVDEFRSAMGALPQDGLEESAQTLSQILEGAADQREDYWKHRVQPFWKPKSPDRILIAL